MKTGSPRDRNVRTQERFEPGVHVHAHIGKRSDSAWFEPKDCLGAHVIGSSSGTAGLAREASGHHPSRRNDSNPAHHHGFSTKITTVDSTLCARNLTGKPRQVSMAHYTDCQAGHAGAGLKASAHGKSKLR